MPNKKHPDVTWENKERARKYGRAHGYGGDKGGGGWIYSKEGKQICHGWGIFYTIHWVRIASWEQQKAQEKAEKQAKRSKKVVNTTKEKQ